MTVELEERPRAETWTVAEIVRDGRLGRLRVPEFQRGIKWGAEDVAMLLDSIYRGYPVGSLLFWNGGPRRDGPVTLGPVHIANPDDRNVRWIVDGQQRVTAMVLALTELGQSDRRFRVWFDPDKRTFQASRRPAPHWLSAHHLLDAAQLQELLYEWAPGTPERRRAVLDAGAKIREYSLPAYVVTSDSAVPLRHIFRRLNRQGKPMEEPEVFDALAGTGRKLHELLPIVADLNWGPLDKDLLLVSLFVHAGLPPTVKLDKQSRSIEDIARDVEGLSAGLVAAVGFLRDHAQIPCVQTLPYRVPLQVLPAFFVRHPNPGARALRLLRRWVWRSFFQERPSSPRHLRAAAKVVVRDGSANDVASGLLALAPAQRIESFQIRQGVATRSNFAEFRLGALGLAALAPLDLRMGSEVDVEAALASSGPLPGIGEYGPYAGTFANRFLHPPMSTEAMLTELKRHTPGVDLLCSHAIDRPAQEALLNGDEATFLELRARAIERATMHLVDTCAEWGAHDGPSVRDAWQT